MPDENGDERAARKRERARWNDQHGDRWSDDIDDRIEWHADQTRRWVRIGVLILIAYILWDVTVRVIG